ncbi:hypothetical protein F5Y14DRAFT_30227 [Nemania sp. NC0429]|nr:hypothetical protein F5Y14DRAFT_30227 [Nemania sp. NC0429]
MFSLKFSWTIGRIFARSLWTILNVILICCGLHLALISAPRWSRWISTLGTLRGPEPRPRVQGRTLSDVDAKFSEKENITLVVGDTNSGTRGRGNWFDFFPLSSLWRRNRLRDRSPPLRAERPIHILHDDSNAAIDIVAVHGLAANPDYAWVWQPKHNPPGETGYPAVHFNWLQELLPAELGSVQLPCRVMTFNYDSKWFMDAPQQRLSNISDNLLTSLRNARDKAMSRPLIFIGHSFGGNLIEQAIVSACRQGSEHTTIAESTVGVIFLGTPHRGSRAASWGALIASLAPPSFAFEDRILRALEEHSDSLADRLHEFSRWLFSESVPIVCCFEQRMTDYSSRLGSVGKLISVNELVVPETSACIDGHCKISLNADHFKINKFYGPDDPSFRLVFPEIERMARNAKQTLSCRQNPRHIAMNESATSGDLRKCLREMRVTNPRDILSHIKMHKGKRVGHTCEWILKREEFLAWGAKDDLELLRLVGSPGIGKTMMSTFLVEVLRERAEKSRESAFAYFFCDDKNQDRKTPTDILRSLIWQLLLQRNELFKKHMQPDFDKYSDSRLFDDLFCNFFPLWRIFQEMLLDAEAGEVFILIDALDECDPSTRKGLLQNIRDFFMESPKLGRKVKLLITCRPEIPDIEGELKGAGVSLRMDHAHINNDLSEYIDFKTNELAEKKGYPPHLKKQVQDALTIDSGGTFLWVSLMVAELGRGDVLQFQVQEKLKRLPRGLDEIYASILDRVSPDIQHVARFILHFMVAAKRPLKMFEIKTAYASSSAACRNTLAPTYQDVQVYNDIFLACSSILYVPNPSKGDRAELNFCHQSVKDFLMGDYNPGIMKWYHTTFDDANYLIFKTCWRYLSAEDCKLGNLIIGREEVDGMVQLDELRHQSFRSDILHLSYPFLKYASYAWTIHAIASQPALLKARDFEIDVTNAPVLRDTWLLQTAREGQALVLGLLLERGANRHVINSLGQTLLSNAAEKGHEAIAKLLLDTGEADLDFKDRFGQTPLTYAAVRGHEAIVKLLLNTGRVDPNSEDKLERTPLLLAAHAGCVANVKLLLDTGKVEPDFKDKRNRTPLFRAVQQGHEAIVELLLDTRKVDPDLHTRDHQTPLSCAVQKGHKAIVKLLLDTDKVDPDLKGEFNRTLLSYATERGDDTIVRLLLNTGKVDPDSKDAFDWTPLLYAAGNGHKAIVKLLLNTGKVNPDSKDTFGRTPLSYAAGKGYEAIVELLLNTSKVDPDSKNKNFNWTPLFYAADEGHEATVKLLLNTGKVDPDSKDEANRTPLSYAVEKGHEGIIKLLQSRSKLPFSE